MKRQVLGRIAAVALAALAVTAPVTSAVADDTGNADAAHLCQQGGYKGLLGSDGTTFTNAGACTSYVARGGTFATGMIIPAGGTATLSDVVLNACNRLTLGYDLSGTTTTLATKQPGCFRTLSGSVTVGPVDKATLLRIVLVDQTCRETYYSDGSHAAVVGSNPYWVDLADAGGFCERRGGTVAPPPGHGNGSVLVTIS